MSATGDWSEASARLKAAIAAQFGTLAEFARRLGMDPTQLTATLRPHRRPTVETLDRFSAVLGWSPSVLREWYGYALAGDNGGGRGDTSRTLPSPEDRRFDPARVIAFVESHPDETFVSELLEEKARRSPAGYEWLCFRIFRAWTSNAHLAMDALRVGRE